MPYSTLNDRINSRTAITERRPVNLKLSKLEEEVITQYLIDLDSRGFAPRLTGVEDMVNYILESRGGNASANSGRIDSFNDNQT